MPGIHWPPRRGGHRLSAKPILNPPQLLSGADMDRMDDLERDLYNEARQDYHSSLLLVATPARSSIPGKS
jgi:hypothetical protein